MKLAAFILAACEREVKFKLVHVLIRLLTKIVAVHEIQVLQRVVQTERKLLSLKLKTLMSLHSSGLPAGKLWVWLIFEAKETDTTICSVFIY